MDEINQLQPMIIIFSQNMTNDEIDIEILKVLDLILNKKISTIHIKCKPWENDGRHISDIPGAKRLFSRTIDRGLLGLFHSFNRVNEAKSLYCNAYLKRKKGKLENKQIKFKGYDEVAFMKKVYISTEALQSIIEE